MILSRLINFRKIRVVKFQYRDGKVNQEVLHWKNRRERIHIQRKLILSQLLRVEFLARPFHCQVSFKLEENNPLFTAHYHRFCCSHGGLIDKVGRGRLQKYKESNLKRPGVFFSRKSFANHPPTTTLTV